MGVVSIPLHGPAMHDHVVRALEIGERAAAWEDSEACGWGALWDARREAAEAGVPPRGDWAADLDSEEAR